MKLTDMKLSALARKFALLCVALTVVLALVSTASACPGCKNALLNDTEGGGNLVAGYFWSILFMMSMPFLLVISFGGSMYLSVRRAHARQAAQAQQTAVAQQPHPTRLRPSRNWSRSDDWPNSAGKLSACEADDKRSCVPRGLARPFGHALAERAHRRPSALPG